MTATVMITRDETAESTSIRYGYSHTVEIAGRVVRARVERDVYINRSFAVAEVLNDQMTWTSLTADAPGNWWHDTPRPSLDVHAATALGAVAERLLHRAAEILAAPPAIATVSPHVHGAIAALLATVYAYDGERCVDPDEITWAITHGGRLHIIEHADGAVTFTKSHREDCPFLTSAGTGDCDDECDERETRRNGRSTS